MEVVGRVLHPQSIVDGPSFSYIRRFDPMENSSN